MLSVGMHMPSHANPHLHVNFEMAAELRIGGGELLWLRRLHIEALLAWPARSLSMRWRCC